MAVRVEHRPRPGQRHQPVGSAGGGAEPLQLGLHGRERGEVLVRGVVAAHVGNGVVRAEPGQGVDVRVGVVAGQRAVLEPEHPLCAEQVSERAFQAGPVQVRVAVRAEQAGGGGQQRARAVAVDAAALEHQPGHPHRHPEQPGRSQAAGHQVVVVGRELEAPGVEAEVEHHRRIVLERGDRPEIPGPGVVRGQFGEQQVERVRALPFQPGAHRRHLRRDDEHPLEPADGHGNPNEHRLHRLERVGPIRGRVRPGKQDRVLLLPFRRQSSVHVFSPSG